MEQFPGVVITVSHDRYFLTESSIVCLCLKEMDVFHTSKVLTAITWSKKKNRSGQRQNQLKTSRSCTEKRKKLSYKDQLEWDGIEDRIQALEDKHQQLEASIAEAGSDFGKIQELMDKQKPSLKN